MLGPFLAQKWASQCCIVFIDDARQHILRLVSNVVLSLLEFCKLRLFLGGQFVAGGPSHVASPLIIVSPSVGEREHDDVVRSTTCQSANRDPVRCKNILFSYLTTLCLEFASNTCTVSVQVEYFHRLDVTDNFLVMKFTLDVLACLIMVPLSVLHICSAQWSCDCFTTWGATPRSMIWRPEYRIKMVVLDIHIANISPCTCSTQ